jgi:hypothetical protein
MKASSMANPLAENPLLTREDVERAAMDLFTPLLPHFSEGGARVKLGSSGVVFSDGAEELEGFARPLWGIIPLVMGGGRFQHWDLYRLGIASGTDPENPEFWGWAERDQRMVEMAAIGFALAFVPEHLWDPLPTGVRDNLVRWLDRINQFPPNLNNWQFFRVLVNLGLQRVGRPFNEQANRESLDLVESYYRGDGWYHDGANDHADYYVAWAMHVYGLLYAAARDHDPEQAARYRERARLFARDFQHWFDPRGAAIPFGRSLTYRFCQGSFWGALVLADEEALPWGRIKGLYLRHLREWATHPISDRDGVLSIGYGYANLLMHEPYNSSGSPYWAMKYFLALAAPADHPFWRAEEEPLAPLVEPSTQRHAGMIISRTETQAVALSGGQTEGLFSNGAAKYGKFAYSSLFGFSVAVHESRPHQGCHDSMLSLRDEWSTWRIRGEYEERLIEEGLIYSRWRPWPDVTVETVLTGSAPWHLRLHRVRTPRKLWSAEAGFALAWDGMEPGGTGFEQLGSASSPLARSPYGVSGVRDLRGERVGKVQPALPNTNLIAPRTVIPLLEAEHEPGTRFLCCAVLATDALEVSDWDRPPQLPGRAWELLERMEKSNDAR